MSVGFRGASAASLASVLEAVDAAKGDRAALGDELFSVAAVLDATPAVRRILTDPSTEPDGRVAVASSLFGSKVSGAAVQIIESAARGRWTGGRALSDAIELAGLSAHVAAAEKSGDLDKVESELFEAQRIIDHERELRSILSDRTVGADRKSTLIDSIFKGKVSATTLALIRQASTGRTGSFDAVLERFADEVAARRNRTLAEVRSAVPLSDKEIKRVRKALASRYGEKVHVNVVVDPSVVGGLKVAIGDDVIDGTIAGRIEDARRQLVG